VQVSEFFPGFSHLQKSPQGTRVRGPEFFRFSPRLEGPLALPYGMRGIERMVFRLRSLEQGCDQNTMSNQVSNPTRRAFISVGVGLRNNAVSPRYMGPAYRVVDYQSGQKPGTIIVDPGNHFLYAVQDARQALQYEVGVGSGVKDIAPCCRHVGL
jgi:hypothetical protein